MKEAIRNMLFMARVNRALRLVDRYPEAVNHALKLRGKHLRKSLGKRVKKITGGE